MAFQRKRRKYTEKDFISFIIMYDRMKEFELVEHYVERISLNK